MIPDIQHAIQTIVRVNATSADEMMKKSVGQSVFAISDDYGAGGWEIMETLAKKYDLTIYDEEILHKIAERSETDTETVRLLDKGVSKLRDIWLYRMFSGKELSTGSYKRHLVNVILSLARAGKCIIVGRGSHVVLSTSAALRVRITGSPATCAKRVMASEMLTQEQAEKRIADVNHNRGKFVWDMFHARLNEPSYFDITLNTDRLGDVDQAVTMLQAAAKAIEDTAVN